MGKHNLGRLAAIVVSVVGFAISLVFNGLSVVGIGLYDTTTANVSAVFDTQITPSGWTFNIWSVIYIWLTAMIIYIVAGLCRKLWPMFFILLFKTLKYCQPFLIGHVSLESFFFDIFTNSDRLLD